MCIIRLCNVNFFLSKETLKEMNFDFLKTVRKNIRDTAS